MDIFEGHNSDYCRRCSQNIIKTICNPPVRMAIIKSLQTINAEKDVDKREPSYCRWECKLIQPLWRTVWSFLKKLKIELPYDLEIPVLGVYLEKTVNSKTCIHPNVYYGTIYNSQNMEATEMSTSRGRLKMWYVYTMEYYLAIKWDEIVPFAEKHCCFCSVVQSCLTLCDPMDYSMPGFPVLHCLPEFAQTHVY